MSQKTDPDFHPSSFRDPAGFIFTHNRRIYRQVNQAGATDYEMLMQSGLYADLSGKNQLIKHTESNLFPGTYKVLEPELIPFISYAYEWSFEMLRDAALLTLDICKTALRYKMILKDATAFNIQFFNGRPIHIDTLSFEQYDESKPWVAYRQFCECFLAPLVLAQYFGNEHLKLLQLYPGGVPVNYVASLLPFRSWFNSLCLLDFHLQAKVSKGSTNAGGVSNFNKQKLLNVLTHLGNGVRALKAPRARTTWDDYYRTTIASADYLAEKDLAFRNMCKNIDAATAIDLGANDGYFSKILAGLGMKVISTDIDSNSINRLYRESVKNILPLILDLTSPSPSLGWINEERDGFMKRAHADLLVAVALVHHLAIAENTPFRMIAEMFAQIADKYLITEFVEKDDEKAVMLLARRNISYSEYTRENFEASLAPYFTLLDSQPLLNNKRRLYLFRRTK